MSRFVSNFAAVLKLNIMGEKTGADLKSAATGTKKLFIETYGCQMNVADSEVIASIMPNKKYIIVWKLYML